MTRRYWMMRPIDRPRLKGAEWLSAMARRCPRCGRMAMVPCMTARGRWARKPHRRRVYPLRIAVVLDGR